MKNTSKVSVLMSVYKKENPQFLKVSIKSILCQTLPVDEIVLVKDGKLTKELDTVINDFYEENPKLFHIVELSENKGLGAALAEGILHCRNQLIARMDSDDISRKDRLELQVKEFEKNPDLDVCGSHIKEFADNTYKIIGTRKVPLIDREIKEYQKLRDGMNHVTVMFKKDTVLRAGNYQEALLMEDSLLWVNMIMNGAVFYNIDDYLVLVRAGEGMIERRGGISYFLKYRAGRKKIKETGYINNFEYYYTLIVQLVVAMVPNSIRAAIFKKILRS